MRRKSLTAALCRKLLTIRGTGINASESAFFTTLTMWYFTFQEPNGHAISENPTPLLPSLSHALGFIDVLLKE